MGRMGAAQGVFGHPYPICHCSRSYRKGPGGQGGSQDPGVTFRRHVEV